MRNAGVSVVVCCELLMLNLTIACRWTLDEDAGVSVIVRCELDGVTQGLKGEDQLLSIKALNEFDLRETSACPRLLVYCT